MQIAEMPGATKRLRRTLGDSNGYFQQTFATPSAQLSSFAATVVAAHAPLESGSVTLEQVVFPPKHLESLLAEYNMPLTYGRDWTITASGQEEVLALLEAAWGDPIDFYFTPEPKRYHIFADHDEYTTIFAATKGHLSKVSGALTAAGFMGVNGYRRAW
jgi:hypothetical protein